MRRWLIAGAIALIGGLVVLALPPSWSPLLTPLFGLVGGMVLGGKWVIICPLFGWALVSPFWGGLLGIALGLGMGLFVFVGLMCGVWDLLRDWD